MRIPLRYRVWRSVAKQLGLKRPYFSKRKLVESSQTDEDAKREIVLCMLSPRAWFDVYDGREMIRISRDSFTPFDEDLSERESIIPGAWVEWR